MRAVLLAKVTVAIFAGLRVRSFAAQGCRPASFRTMRITSEGTPDLTACVAGMLWDDIPRRSVRRSAHEALDAILIADAVDLAVSEVDFDHPLRRADETQALVRVSIEYLGGVVFTQTDDTPLQLRTPTLARQIRTLELNVTSVSF
jgi:hypothetical protein